MSWQHEFCENVGGKLAVKLMENAMIAVMKEMIEAGCDINELYWDDLPMWAILLGDREVPASIIDFLLRHGAMIPKEGEGTPSLLIKALKNQMDRRIIDLLIEHGVDAAYVGEKEGETALQYACSCREYPLALFKLLVEKGSPVNVQEKRCGNSALGNAALNGLDSKIIAFLLEAGADVNVVDSEGNAPLMRLCMHQYGIAPTVRLLIEQGAKLDAVNSDGYSVLGIAANTLWGDCGLAEYLLELGMDVNTVEGGRTYLMMALGYDNWDVAEALIKGGFTNFEYTDEEGKTVFDLLDEEDRGTLQDLIEQYRGN